MMAPIVLFAYNRPDHIRQTVESLQRNKYASDSDLIIYSDAALSSTKQDLVDIVRIYLKKITGFRSITIHCRPYNFGLSRSIIDGVTNTLKQYERVIVLEDDMAVSPYFLSYMNEALDRFVDDERVVSIHGWLFSTKFKVPEAFFLPGADCWGWATWRRGWSLFNPNGQVLLDDLNRRDLRKAFDVNGTYPYTRMLEDQIKGINDSWAIRWYASAFLAGKLTLYPGRSLVHNIGNDSSGTHCSKTDKLDVKLSATPIDLEYVNVTPSIEGRAAQEDFFRQTQGGLASKVLARIKQIVSKVVA